MKRRLKCDNEKEISEFNFRKDTQKYRNQCRECIKPINKEYRTMNKDEIKIRRKKYRENITYNLRRLYDFNYRERNREKNQLYKKIISKIIKKNYIRKVKRKKMKISNSD